MTAAAALQRQQPHCWQSLQQNTPGSRTHHEVQGAWRVCGWASSCCAALCRCTWSGVSFVTPSLAALLLRPRESRGDQLL
jgi:hypothetical protein